MRKFLPFLFAAALASSCIDNAYDLSNVNTDDVTIGDEDSEYRLPLATVYVSMSELNEGGADIKTLFDEADIWLPSPLPGNAAYVDLRELQNTPETITPLLDALIDQMMDDDAKITAVADLLAEKYLSTFLPLLPPNTDPADFKPVFIEAFRNMPMLHDRLSGEVKSLAGSYLTELKVQDVTYDIGKIDIGGDVVDMLCENLDSEGTPNPKNTLHLYGSITSALPVSLRLVPYFSPTNVRFDVTVEPGKTNEIRETQLFESDLRQIIEGAEIILPVSLEKYYPGYDFTSDQQIVITLLPPNTDPADFKPVFIEAFRNMPMLHDRLSGEVKSLAGSYLTELKVQDVTYDIGKIDIGGDVVDMLCENLDSEGTPNPKNTLHLYGSITSALPVSLRLVPYFSPTNVRFDVTVEPGKTNEIRETQLFESDLRQIIEGAEIILPVSLEKYYPGYDFTSDQQIVITLRLIKRGGLKLNL